MHRGSRWGSVQICSENRGLGCSSGGEGWVLGPSPPPFTGSKVLLLKGFQKKRFPQSFPRNASDTTAICRNVARKLPRARVLVAKGVIGGAGGDSTVAVPNSAISACRAFFGSKHPADYGALDCPFPVPVTNAFTCSPSRTSPAVLSLASACQARVAPQPSADAAAP